MTAEYRELLDLLKARAERQSINGVGRLLGIGGASALAYYNGRRFRRTMATEYLKANRHDLEGLRLLMRHEHLATTLSYVFLEPADLTPSLARVRL